ncbi:hypothetical protein FHR93_002808 [Geodermatophilus sabuli]|uniref:Uncharacterized protein n=1 Tax=Geodermatophilus sabuli TaxID=1564158 RepID=A0A285EDJ5_9ACTN|nr:hypothetical protein [Geodermatophilus sabuli]SNX97212.1 hypothetical protein SAMN06893097_106162 [Geodermatophilus sabuli]
MRLLHGGEHAPPGRGHVGAGARDGRFRGSRARRGPTRQAPGRDGQRGVLGVEGRGRDRTGRRSDRRPGCGRGRRARTRETSTATGTATRSERRCSGRHDGERPSRLTCASRTTSRVGEPRARDCGTSSASTVTRPRDAPGNGHPSDEGAVVDTPFIAATFSDDGSRRVGRGSSQVGAAVLDHHLDHHCARFALVLCGPSSFRMPFDLLGRTSTNCRGHAAVAWGSRGRRFKSCQPDRGKPQLRGRLRRDPERPLGRSGGGLTIILTSVG